MKKLIVFLFQCILIPQAFTQEFDQLPQLDSNLDEWYSQIMGKVESPILKGTHYYQNPTQIISPGQTPFYKEGWDRNGSITYEGRSYSNINIIYNTSEDRLLIWSWEMPMAGEKSLLINQAKIDSFTIYNEKFISYKHAEIGKEGFYREVRNGQQIDCFSKEVKSGTLEQSGYEFEANNQFFIKYQGRIIEYKRPSSLSEFFPERKKDIKKFVKDNFTARRDQEAILIAILNYCESFLK